ncbi:MAG TPA: enoyl-CoA hydratase-related protein [Kofleriaceae bacterium]|nr:enoyl-CoA hydratase-related protein [Kofleriaceae bacterium]
MTSEVHVSDQDGVRWIELRRPESRNALTPAVNRELIEALRGGDAAGARVMVLGGAGGHFCSGLDLKESIRSGPRPPAELEKDLRETFHGLIRAVRAAPQPVIAAVDGPAVGFGCDLALACEVRLVSTRARFGEIFVRRGLMPDGGGSYSLARLVGLGRAFDLLLTGDQVEAVEAVRIGMASRLFADDFAGGVRDYVTALAKGPPLVYQRLKRAVYASLGDLDAALDREAEGQMQLIQSADFVEGVAAFLQKREPRFSGK